MYKNDLSNRMMPRLVVVFEGAVGVVPDEKAKDYHKIISRRKVSDMDWWHAIKCYDLNNLILSKILDLHWRKDINVSVVTWLGEGAALAISERLDDEGIPAGVFASTPVKLARELVYRPDIIAVYDPDPDHVFTYPSGRGVILTDANQIGRL